MGQQAAQCMAPQPQDHCQLLLRASNLSTRSLPDGRFWKWWVCQCTPTDQVPRQHQSPGRGTLPVAMQAVSKTQSIYCPTGRLEWSFHR